MISVHMPRALESIQNAAAHLVDNIVMFSQVTPHHHLQNEVTSLASFCKKNQLCLPGLSGFCTTLPRYTGLEVDTCTQSFPCSSILAPPVGALPAPQTSSIPSLKKSPPKPRPRFLTLGSTLPVHWIEGAGLPVAVQRNSARWPCWTVRTAGWIVTVGLVTSPATASKHQLITYKKGWDVIPHQYDQRQGAVIHTGP